MKAFLAFAAVALVSFNLITWNCLILQTVFQLSAVSADDACLMIPNVKVGTCCKQVEMVDKSVIEDAYRELAALNHSEFMMQCVSKT